MTTRNYIVRETLIGSVINGAISAGFYFAVFNGQVAPAVWGTRGLVVDGLPQGFMIGLMSVLVPTLLARKAVSNGKLERTGQGAGAPRSLVVRALLGAVAGLAIITGVSALLGLVTGAEAVAFGAGLALKVAAGILLPWALTPAAIRAVIADPMPAAAAAKQEA